MLKRLIAALAAVAVTGALALAASLNITGTNNEFKNSIFQVGVLRISRDETITATPSGSITTAYQLTAGLSVVTTSASSGDAVKLPITTPTGGSVPAGGGLVMIIVNGAASNAINIFPYQAADIINAGSAGASYSLAAGKTAICVAGLDGHWYCVLSA